MLTNMIPSFSSQGAETVYIRVIEVCMSWSLGPPSILSLGIYKFQGWLYGDNNQLGYITAKPL